MLSPVTVAFAGATAELCALYQNRTYEGLIEGLPTRPMNAKRIESLCQRYPGAYVVPCPERPIDIGRPYPFGEPAELPPVQCIARFSAPGFTHRSLWVSELTVIWFQWSWCLPIEPDILDHLRSVSWREHASEEEL